MQAAKPAFHELLERGYKFRSESSAEIGFYSHGPPLVFYENIRTF